VEDNDTPLSPTPHLRHLFRQIPDGPEHVLAGQLPWPLPWSGHDTIDGIAVYVPVPGGFREVATLYRNVGAMRDVEHSSYSVYEAKDHPPLSRVAFSCTLLELRCYLQGKGWLADE
jgi:hypothetical protein